MPEDLLASFEEAHRRMEQHDEFFIVSPAPPDFDSLPSCQMLGEYAKAFQKSCHYFCSRPLPSLQENSFMAFLSNIPFSQALPVHLPSCVLIPDYGSFKTTGLNQFLSLFPTETDFIGFDHHAGPAQDFPVTGLQVVDPTAASTTQLLYHFFEYIGIPLTSEVATAVYLGIYTDTGRLIKHPEKVTADVHRVLASCIEKGARAVEIQRAAEPVTTLEQLDVWMFAKRYVHIDHEIGLASLTVYREQLINWHASAKDILTFFGKMQELQHVQVATLFLQEKNGWKVLLRSKNPQVPMHLIAQAVGGPDDGGHAYGAVAHVHYSGETLLKIKHEVKKYLNLSNGS